ncbi:MAG: DUF3450 domain-containing protein [Myxococcota bacterium]
MRGLKQRFLTWRGAVVIGAAIVVVPMLSASAGEIDTAIEFMVKANTVAAASQNKVEDLSDDAFSMLQEYRELQRRIESLKTYNDQVTELVTNQSAEVESLRDQIEGAVLVGREITPLMLKMIDSLESFVQLDVPFLMDERTSRIERLKRMMNDPNVTDSEKFRQVMEAYAIENSYGRTIEDYKAKLQDDDRTVDFLRVGRVALLYMTADGEEAGMWDSENKGWTKVDSAYFNEIRKGLRIARKQAAPDLMRLPIRAPSAEGAAPVPPPKPPRPKVESTDTDEEETDSKKDRKNGKR